MLRFIAVMKDESGAVTVDFVVLSAIVVAMAMLIYPTISPSVSGMAEYTGETVDEYHDLLSKE
jgi:Flp pilus assembly pilin Flp